MAPQRKKNAQNPETPEYQRLVENIKKLIADAARQGVDIFQRDDLLSCRCCKAYEDVTFEGRWVVCQGNEKLPGMDKFIVIDSVERSYTRGAVRYYKTTHEFICPVCGAWQKAAFHSRFED